MCGVSPLEHLANAIIMRAVTDYRRLWDRDITDPEKQKIIAFFRSEWFCVLTKTDCEWLIERLEKEAYAKRKKVYRNTETLP